MLAATSLWCRPQIVELLQQETDNPTARWFFNVRRAKKEESSLIGSFVGGNYLDDNSKANIAIKTSFGYQTSAAASKRMITNFHTCHIYDKQGETYSPEYHCSIPNLVLVPSAIHSLTDHSEECRRLLKYRTYDLYGFFKGEKAPLKPAYYDSLDSIWHAYVGSLEAASKSVRKRTSLLVPKNQ